MKSVYCTLYNSMYLDKGLVVFESLQKCAIDFILYVLCMDDKCFEVLYDIGTPKLVPIRLSEIENDEMILAKNNRSSVEYCWTCTPRLVHYIIEKYEPNICTYIDADMYFYNNPQIIIDEMLSAGKSVMMVPHRFTKRNIKIAKTVGTYCVEFNCFKNDAAGLEVLNHWYKKCLECCSKMDDGVHFGDQKYMDEWPVIFNDKVHVCEHPGAGIAPWNFELYKDYDEKSNTLYYLVNKQRYPIIFYHFQSIKYIDIKKISTGVRANLDADYRFVERLYMNYLKEIDNNKVYLQNNYGIFCLIKTHPSNNFIIKLKEKIKKILSALTNRDKEFIVIIE